MSEILIKDLPLEERPRERLLQVGAESLSATELLAIILRTGSKEQSAVTLSQLILQKSEGLQNLNDISINELLEIPGIGPSKAVQVLASIELGIRVVKSSVTNSTESPSLANPEDSFKLLGTSMKHLKQENFIVLFLDVRQKLICKETIFVGTLDMAIVHPREVFRKAIKHLATFIVCVHNHPSGDLTASPQDLLFTKQLAEAGELMSIPLLDHIIIGGDDYVSLKALGHL
ncbi:MAG: DNA repair protein RadC [Turicibacter sp.]|nr:DNA repair protein RadC [Turicibacter sp.]